jgi:hypothetical protein
MRSMKRIVSSVLLTVLAATTAAAQDHGSTVRDRQFMFSVSTLPTDVRHATVDMDFGFGERAFDVTDGDRPEQRFGIQASVAPHRTATPAMPSERPSATGSSEEGKKR